MYLKYRTFKIRYMPWVLSLFFVLTPLVCIYSETWASPTKEQKELIEGAKKEGKLVWYTGIRLDESTQLLKKFEEEYRRVAKFQKAFFDAPKKQVADEDFDSKRYALHVLTEGGPEEKRELLGMCKNKLVLTGKTLVLQGLSTRVTAGS